MAAKEFVRRTGDCRIKLSPDMMLRLEKMADTYGMPSATLAAFALAEWLNQKESGLAMSRMAVMDIARKAGGALEGQLNQLANDPEFERMVLASSGALSQPQLPLDNEVPQGTK